MSYDYSKLRGKIVEVFGKNEPFATAMDMSERTLSLKLNRAQFRQVYEIVAKREEESRQLPPALKETIAYISSSARPSLTSGPPELPKKG